MAHIAEDHVLRECETCVRARLLEYFRRVGDDVGEWELPFVLMWRSGMDLGVGLKGERLSQERIAERLGRSQMHVSRLEKMGWEALQERYGDELEQVLQEYDPQVAGCSA